MPGMAEAAGELLAVDAGMIRVDPEHFAFLKLQKGSLDEYAHNFADWHRRYDADLQQTLDGIAEHLPASCGAILDIGSGLGGIDALLSRYYQERGQDPHVSLLDGVDDDPVMNLHRQTFNSMAVARNFLVKNGVPALKFGYYAPDAPGFDRRYDLVVSFGSWCFHYPPRWYLERVAKTALHADSVVILDVRRHRRAWMDELGEVLELVTVPVQKPKWSRCVFRVRK